MNIIKYLTPLFIIVLIFAAILVNGKAFAQKKGRQPNNEDNTSVVSKRLSQDITSIDDLIGVMQKEFFKTPSRKELIKNLKAYHYSANSYQSDAPWSTNTTFENSVAVTDPDLIARNKTGAFNLNYRHRNGAQGLFRYDLATTSDYNLNGRSTPETYKLQLGYDLLQGGFYQSYDEISAQINELSSKASIQSSLYSLREQKNQFSNLVLDLYLKTCLLKDLKVVSRQLDESKKTAQAQLSTKTISSRDYLMLANLSDSFQIRLQQTRQSLKSLLLDFQNYSDELFQLASDISEAEKICTIPEKLPSKGFAKFDEKIIQKLPEVQQTELQMQASEKQLHSFSALDRPSFAPYVATVNYRKIGNYRNYNETLIGFTFSYTFGGDPRNQQKKSSLEQYESARIQNLLSQRQLDSNIKKMLTEISSQQEIYPIAYSSYQDSLKLIQILNAQRSIGMSDINSLSNAYQTWSDRVQQLRQIYVTTKQYHLTLESYLE